MSNLIDISGIKSSTISFKEIVAQIDSSILNNLLKYNFGKSGSG